MNEKKRTMIARIGTFADSQGVKHVFTCEDFARIANNYNEGGTKAPLVFGHEFSDRTPAYGWVERLENEGGKLFASFAHVSEKVRELVQNGFYKNVSMSIDKEKSRLLHVALLGAAAPAIDGLGEIEFSAQILDNAETITFNTDLGGFIQNENAPAPQKEDGKNMDLDELATKIDALAQKVGTLESALAQKPPKEKLPSENGSEDGSKNGVEKSDTELEKTKAEFSAYKADVEEKTRLERVEKMVTEGKITPAQKDEVLLFARELSKVSTPFTLSDPSALSTHAHEREGNFSASTVTGEGTDKGSMTLEEKYLSGFESRSASLIRHDFSSFATPRHAKKEVAKVANTNEFAKKL